MKSTVSAHEAASIVAEMVCSNCYGHLVSRLIKTGTLIECPNCGDECRGFVSKSYAEKRKEESRSEKLEAQQVLKGIIPNPNDGKSESDLLKELGF